MEKIVTIRTVNFSREGTRELADALRAVDTDIEVRGTMALSGHTFTQDLILIVMGAGLGELAKRACNAIEAWAETWLTKDPDTEVVQILDQDGRVVSEVRRPRDQRSGE